MKKTIFTCGGACHAIIAFNNGGGACHAKVALATAAACSQTCQSQQGECGGGGLGNGGSNLVVVQHAQSNIGELLIASIGPKTNGG